MKDLLQKYLMAKKDIEIESRFELGSSDCRSDALSNWATGTLALEQRIDGIYFFQPEAGKTLKCGFSLEG